MREDPLTILSQQYDLVCNGNELASGAIRNHRPDVMVRAFEIAGYDEEEVKERFGGLFSAFHFGAPPHGGMAFGMERIVMLLADETNLREVTLFPMNQRAEDLMMAPRLRQRRRISGSCRFASWSPNPKKTRRPKQRSVLALLRFGGGLCGSIHLVRQLLPASPPICWVLAAKRSARIIERLKRTRTMISGIAAWFCARNPSVRTSASTSVSAITSAVRGAAVIRAVSPNIAPLPRVATVRLLALTATSP